jgi:hypothetical protein
MKFSEYKTGLYYHDAAAAAPKTNVAPVIDYSFVTTVAISPKVQFRTVAPVLDRKKYTLLRETKEAVVALYQSRGPGLSHQHGFQRHPK